MFGRVGPVARVRLPSSGAEKDAKTGGFAFVRFHFRADAAKAMRQLNAKPFKKKSRVIAVDWASGML